MYTSALEDQIRSMISTDLIIFDQSFAFPLSQWSQRLRVVYSLEKHIEYQDFSGISFVPGKSGNTYGILLGIRTFFFF